MDAVERIARAVLYEGYVLWPYRRSSTKNHQRWTFGVVYPDTWASSSGTGDISVVHTECIVAGKSPTVEAGVRFLHIVDRQVLDDGAPVDELEAAGTRYLTWDEATERSVTFAVRPQAIERLFTVEAGAKTESVDGTSVALRRSWNALQGTATAHLQEVAPGYHRVIVEVSNATDWSGTDRSNAQRSAFASLHIALKVTDGQFISNTDPPDELRDLVASCRNDGVWPVLVGEEDSTDTMLSAAIILPDYPQIAPESDGDMFDGTEVDELLLLSVLGMTDEERDEMRATDPRVREILARAESFDAEGLMNLHGTIRGMRPLEDA